MRRLVFAALTVTGLAATGCTGSDSHPDKTPSSSPSVTASTAASTGPSVAAGPPTGLGYDGKHVEVQLHRVADGPDTVSFGLPVGHGVLPDANHVKVSVGGKAVKAVVHPLLTDHDKTGAVDGVRAVQIQLPASALTGDDTKVDLEFAGGSPDTSTEVVPFTKTSVESPQDVSEADYTIKKVNGAAKLATSHERKVTLFTGREPAVMAEYPAGYLAATGIIGPQILAGDPREKSLQGLKFISDNITHFGLSAAYDLGYPLNPAEDSVVVPDPDVNYEAWLYDRCATFLSFYVHTDDPRFLELAYRNCSYYASKIILSGENLGYFSGKAELDAKYSHLRGLYAYFALTGDELAKQAGTAIADLWKNEPNFVGPYAQGHVRSPDAQWTERLLGVSMEGLVFGFLLTDNKAYLDTFGKELDTAYRHITGDAATLAKINPGTAAFPPENCFIHTAEQHGEGNADEPWCSGWMSELLLPPLLEFQAMTNDPRVDEIFVRLSRFMRDVGSSYFQGDRIDDTFLKPQKAYDPSNEDDPRLLTPLYGAGLFPNGKRHNAGEFDDVQHCLDGTALVAAGIRGLKRQGNFDKNPIGPFKSEGASFLALENELLFCSQWVFTDQTRANRDPSTWSSDMLKDGLSDPAKFIADNKIGYPKYNNSPERRLSWWFNSGLLDYGLLAEAGVSIAKATPGQVEP